MERNFVIDNISNSLKVIPNIETYIFGSSARGDYRDESDIDLLVLLPDNIKVKERIDMEKHIHDLLLPIEFQSGFDISPLILQKKIWEGKKSPFTLTVEKERIRI